MTLIDNLRDHSKRDHGTYGLTPEDCKEMLKYVGDMKFITETYYFRVTDSNEFITDGHGTKLAVFNIKTPRNLKETFEKQK